MSRRVLMAALAASSLILCAGGARAAAGAVRPTALGVGAALSQPFGDFGDAAKLGFAFTGFAERPLDDRFSWGGELLIDRHAAKDLPSALGGGNVDGNFTVIGVSPYLSYHLYDKTGSHPYLRAGLGVYHSSSRIDATSVLPERKDSSTDFGVRVGAGALVELSASVAVGVSAD